MHRKKTFDDAFAELEAVLSDSTREGVLSREVRRKITKQILEDFIGTVTYVNGMLEVASPHRHPNLKLSLNLLGGHGQTCLQV